MLDLHADLHLIGVKTQIERTRKLRTREVLRRAGLLLWVLAVGLAALAGLVALAGFAAADDYPARPITLIVPYPAGGGNDVLARMVAAKMSVTLGQPIVIENRGGAGSTIGTRDVARSTPDGYTLLIATSSLAINPQLYPDTAYDPVKDFSPVILLATLPLIMTVTASLPAQSVADVIALAKARPGQLTFASAGTGGAPHLAGELPGGGRAQHGIPAGRFAAPAGRDRGSGDRDVPPAADAIQVGPGPGQPAQLGDRARLVQEAQAVLVHHV